MSEPFVSAYDKVFMDAFDKGIKKMPQDLSSLVKTMLDKFHEETLDSLQNYILDDMKSNLDLQIQDYAADVARSMLTNALAGDDKEIRNLFGFDEWYMKHPYIGDKPTQWALIDAIVARNPDIFVMERLAQRESEIVGLTRQISELTRQIDYLKSGECSQ